MEHVCTSFDVGGRAKGKITLHGKKERIHRQKIIHTCCEIRLKCLTLPRLSLLAISGVQTLGTLHSKTRSFDRQNHLTAMLKTELLQHYACCVVGNEPAIKFSTGAKMAPVEGPPDSAGTKINLSMLIDFLLQKTYHDLTVLSEL